MIASLSNVAEQHRLARLTRHGELVLMRTPPTIAIGTAQVTLPPGSFLQATAAGEEALAALVTGHCKRAKHIADLFCGVGPFALRLAAKSRISAFDSDAGAVTALQKAATSTSGLKPVKAEARDLFRRPLMPQELRDYDTVVFDPPRQGAQAQVQQLAASKIPVVVAVSCNVATFARDARILIDGGYKIERRHAGRPVPPHPACRAGGAVHEVARAPDAVQRSSRCTAEPGPTRFTRWTPDQQRITIACRKTRMYALTVLRSVRGTLATSSPPAVLPDLLADQAGHARLLLGHRHDRRSGVRPATSSSSLVRIASLNFSRSLIDTTKEPGPPITQSS